MPGQLTLPDESGAQSLPCHGPERVEKITLESAHLPGRYMVREVRTHHRKPEKQELEAAHARTR